MPTRATQQAMARSTYIPPQVQSAMESHMREALPAHLQQYVGPNRPAYIPQAVERQLSSQLQKSMPEHLRQYSDAYVQQKIVDPSLASPMQAPGTTIRPHPPVPDLLKRDHSIPFGEQHTVEMNVDPHASARPAPEQPAPRAALPQDEGPKPPTYDFIFNPNEQKPSQDSKLPSLPGLNANFSKIILALIGAILVVFVVGLIKNAVSGPGNYPYLLSVLQDQEELMHLVSNSTQQQQQDISGTNLNYAWTTDMAMTSSSTQLLNYLAANGHKVKSAKLLMQKISPADDQTLANAELAGTYNQEFAQVNTTLLQGYINDLKTAYNYTTGVHGRALLSSDYNQAVLLLTQVNSNVGST
jgi:hypothetical protein